MPAASGGRYDERTMRKVYLDNNASTAVDPRVVSLMTPLFLEDFGNAASIHGFGQRARSAVEAARRKIASLLNAQPKDIIFTAGGTEADNTAVRGVASRHRDRGRHLITTAIEHPAVLKSCERLQQEGFEITYLEVDDQGLVRVDQLQSALREDTVLVSVMHANNEVGSVQPLDEISRLVKANGTLLHTDAVQSVGKIRVDLQELEADLLSLSAHKLHGPKGVGALFARSNVSMDPLLLGGSHERSRRAGTENVPGIAGLGEACHLAGASLEDFNTRVRNLRDQLERGILENVPDSLVNGTRDRRMPHVTNISFLGLEGEALLIGLDFQGIAVSTGAACSSGSLAPSHVLTAMGLERSRIQGAIRFSLSRMTTQEDIDYVLDALPPMVARMREMGSRLRG